MTKIERTLFASLLGISVAIGAACVAKADEPAKPKPCFVEGSAILRSNQQVEGPRILQNSLGIGCRTPYNGITVGGGLRLDMGSGQRQGIVYGTAGIGLNETGTNAYGIAGFQFDAAAGVNSVAINKGGVVVLGGGVEQRVMDGVHLFAEGTKDFASIGAARNLQPLYVLRSGVRVSF